VKFASNFFWKNFFEGRKVIGRYALTFWADHAVSEIKVTHIKLADQKTRRRLGFHQPQIIFKCLKKLNPKQPAPAAAHSPSSRRAENLFVSIPGNLAALWN
jgi:hypothetical protein